MSLASEIADDPLGRGYSSMSEQEIADDMNTVYRQRPRDTMTSSEVANAIDPAEFIGLTNAQEQEIWNWLHLGVLNPFGIEATRFTAIFGGGSTTITALQAMRQESISRATELGLGVVTLKMFKLESIS